jgi:hypothetical protein
MKGGKFVVYLGGYHVMENHWAEKELFGSK